MKPNKFSLVNLSCFTGSKKSALLGALLAGLSFTVSAQTIAGFKVGLPKATNGLAMCAIVQGALPGNDSGGVAFLSYPANYNFPEPMRIWTLNTNGRGDMSFSFAPTKDRNWLLEPGKTYVLKYRMVVFNGKFDAAKAESAWQYFAEPTLVKVTKK